MTQMLVYLGNYAAILHFLIQKDALIQINFMMMEGLFCRPAAVISRNF